MESPEIIIKTESDSTTVEATTIDVHPEPHINEKVWLYEENIRQLYTLDDHPDRKNFLDEFFTFRRKKGLYSKIPIIARKPLDVFLLYYVVQKYGGFEQTMKNRMWSQIARELDLPKSMTSGAFTLKIKYIRLLYQFECFKCQKQVNHSVLLDESSLVDREILIHDLPYRNDTILNRQRERDYETIRQIELRRNTSRGKPDSIGQGCRVNILPELSSSSSSMDSPQRRQYDERNHSPSYTRRNESTIARNEHNERVRSSQSRSPIDLEKPSYADHRRVSRATHDAQVNNDADYISERDGLKRSHSDSECNSKKKQRRMVKDFSLNMIELEDDRLAIRIKVNGQTYEGSLFLEE